jgi:tetratricopeptide (TPR) repeat protein
MASMQVLQSTKRSSGSVSIWLVGTTLLLLVLGGLLLVWQRDPWGWRRGSPDGTVAHHWEKALTLIENRDFAAAKDHLARCLEISPFNGELQFLMAQTCRRADDAESWAYHLGNARSLHWAPDQIELEQRLAEAQFGNIWGMEDQLRDEARQAPPYAKVMIVEAMIKGFLDNERPKEAYRLARAWTEDYPQDWVGWLLLGRTCQLGALFPEAIEDFERCLKINPDQPQTQLWLAETLLSQVEFDKALDHFVIYLKTHPDDPDGLIGLARCQYSLGHVDLARTTLDQLLQTNDKHALALLTRAQLEQGEAPEAALPWLRRAEAVAPNEPEILQNLALVLRIMHRDQEAEQYQQRKKDRDLSVRRVTELQMRLIRESTDKKDTLDLRYQIGLLNLELGKVQEAQHWFQTVLWIDADHGPTLRTLADYWEKHGNPERAAQFRARLERKTATVSSHP